MLFSTAKAHDFVVTINNQKIYFAIVDDAANTAIVTYQGSIANFKPSEYAGELVVPAKVKHNNKVYTIVGIGAKAFSGAQKLTGIILPNNITEIGNFAFEGCSALEKIVFPNKQPKFGQGTFFKCDKINSIKFGDDWSRVNLVMFQWSDSLKTVNITAGIEKIEQLKKLKHLESISVDENNSKFTSINGVLYNKDCNILYGCPQAYAQPLCIPEGVTKVTTGAFIDCYKLEIVDLPKSIETISFREFSRLENLKEVTFRADKPINTAKHIISGKACFLLQMANPQAKVVTSKNAVKAYKKSLAMSAGEYSDIDQKLYVVNDTELLKAKNIKGVKFKTK